MLENLKTKVQDNPEQAKKIGIAVGAVVGAGVIATLIYLNRETVLTELVEEAADLSTTE